MLRKINKRNVNTEAFDELIVVKISVFSGCFRIKPVSFTLFIKSLFWFLIFYNYFLLIDLLLYTIEYICVQLFR